MTTRRFAETTTVPAHKTQGEIKDRLRQVGADQIMIYESAERSAVAFRVSTAMFRITVPINPKAKNRDQEERRAWRLMSLLIKSKLEAVREGATTIEREFLADMLLYDGQTVSERLGPELQIARSEGRMPKTLLLEGPAHD